MKPALTCFPSKNRQSIVNYYFNVHIPQRIRSFGITINTDDEDEEEEVTSPRRSRKRNRANKGVSTSSGSLKTKFLSSRR